MFMITDIYNLIKELMDEAEKNKNEKLYSKLIDIKKQMNFLEVENEHLKNELDIRNKRIFDENANSFTLPETKNIHYCSVCYGNSGKLIPMVRMNNKDVCRICYEILAKGVVR